MEKDFKKIYDVIVVGGGAAGMMAAAAATEYGADVLILEGKDKTGNKLLRTGNGKCNYSNYDIGIKDYYFEHKDFIETSFAEFGQADTVSFFESIGIYPLEKKGYLYPLSETASSLRMALDRHIRDCGTEVLTNVKVNSVRKRNDDLFIINNEFAGKAVILAAGSMAAPDSGSDGSGYKLAESMGHTVIKPLPALVQLTADKRKCRMAAGVRSTGTVTLEIETEKNNYQTKYDNTKNAKNSIPGNIKYSEKGEIQYTEYGISGIPVFQLSRFAVKALDEGNKVYAYIDMLPDCPIDYIKNYIKNSYNSSKTMEEFFSGILNRKLVRTICTDMNTDPDAAHAASDYRKVLSVFEHMKNYRLEITGFKSFDSAQVCQGGVRLSEIDSHTMESRKISGLYFAGEIMDVDGRCGGYNLQWAWTSGHIAGVSAARSLYGRD